MASANDPNKWKLEDIRSKLMYVKFISALHENKFNHDKLRELVVEAAHFFREKAKALVALQEKQLTEEVPYRVRVARNTANKQRGGPALRQVLNDLVRDISSDEKVMKDDVKALDTGVLEFLLSQEIFLSVLSLNTLDIGSQGKKYLTRTPVYITKTKGGRIAIPISVEAAEIIDLEKKHGQSDLMKHILKLPNNVNWANVRPAKAKPKNAKPTNALIAVGPVVNYPANNTRRRGVIKEVNGVTHINNRGILTKPANRIKFTVKPNRPRGRNSPANFPAKGPDPTGLNRGANPVRALANRRLMPRGPAGIVPSPELAELPPLPHYRRSGGTRKKKNK